MKRIFIALSFFFIALSAFTCDENFANPCGDGDWLNVEIQKMKRNTGSKALIEQYRYKDQVAISVTYCDGCADAMTIVYDCAGQELCKFGGIAGFNTCPDFANEATFVSVIYRSR